MITVNTDEHFMRQALREAEQSFKVDEIPGRCRDRLPGLHHRTLA